MTNFRESFNILFFSFRFEYRTRNLQGTKRYKQTKAKTRHRNRADREARGVDLWKLCGPCGNSFRWTGWLPEDSLSRFAIQWVKARHSHQWKGNGVPNRRDFYKRLIWFNSPILTTKMPQELHKWVFERNLQWALVKTQEQGTSLHFLMMLYLWIVNFKPF